MMKQVKKYTIYTIPTVCYQFFQYRALPILFLKLSGFISSFILFIISFKEIFNKSYRIGTIPFWIKTIILLSLFSYITAFIVWDQPLPNSFRSSIDVLNLSFFFVLVKWKVDVKLLIRLMKIYAIVAVLLWLYAVSQFPNLMFGMLGEDDVFLKEFDNRGGLRFSIVGSRFVILCFFYYLGKALNLKGNKRLWAIILSLVTFIFSCADKTRSNIASIVIAGIIMVYIHSKSLFSFILKITLVSVILFGIIFYYFGDTIIALVELTEDQFTSGSDVDDGFWRIKEYIYFFAEFKNSIYTVIFGNGFANHSSLQIYLDSIKINKGFYLSDVNYATIFITLGIAGLWAYMGLMYNLLKQKINHDYIYAKIYLVYVIFSNFTIASMTDSIPLAICAYIIYNNNEIK